MSKIVQAINSMISNQALITDVKASYGDDDEYYFRYNKKYVWSIIERDNNIYSLIYYPESQDVKHLASIPPQYWDDQDIATVIYRSSDIGTKEAISSFQELYQVVKEKVYGMEDILDDIIGDDEL